MITNKLIINIEILIKINFIEYTIIVKRNIIICSIYNIQVTNIYLYTFNSRTSTQL